MEGDSTNNNNDNNNNTAVNVSVSGGGAASAAATAAGYSRWNPTKEQIDMLEGLYKQGIRTPSAEQIQQITARLRAFGHIEGKNVFYWFQNHKARQRQKQKQDTVSYFNRFVHHNHRYHHNTITTTATNAISSSSLFSPYPNSNG